MPRTPDVTVAAVTETAGRFLVVEERINHRLVFNQPAGHVERGETLFAAVVREVLPSVVLIRTPNGLGSGVVLDGQGNIVTNARDDQTLRIGVRLGELPGG